MSEDFGEKHHPFFFAEVRDINDELKSGRVQLRMYGKNDDTQNVSDENLRWGMPMQSVTSAATAKVGTVPTGMRKGSRVMVTFAQDDPERQYPIILGSYARGAPPQQGSQDNTQGKSGLDQQNYGVDIPATAQGTNSTSTSSAMSVQGPPYNKKLEESPFESQRSNPQYPYVYGTMDDLGRQWMVYANPSDANSSVEEFFQHDGGYETREYNSNNQIRGLNNKLIHHDRKYASVGKSVHADGHHDAGTDSSRRQTAMVDHGKDAAGDGYKGFGGQEIGGGKQARYKDHSTGTQFTVGGDAVGFHASKMQKGVDGDYMHVTSTGNHYTIVSDGEHGMHTQTGNFDHQIDKGKSRWMSGDNMSHVTGNNYSMTASNTASHTSTEAFSITSSNSGVTISAKTSITLQVGGSSITITPNDITHSANSNLNLNAQQKVTTYGQSGTSIQRGGTTAPPTLHS